MTRIAISLDEDHIVIEHVGVTTFIREDGTPFNSPSLSFDEYVGLGDTLVFDNTKSAKPEPVVLEHREGEYVHFSINNFEFYGQFLDGYWHVRGAADEAWEPPKTPENFGWLTDKYGREHYPILSHGFLADPPERKLVWPAGTRVRRTDGSKDGLTRITNKDYYEGDDRIYYDLTCFDGVTEDFHHAEPEKLKRVYVAGDVLPVYERMTANGLVEYPGGERQYLEAGVKVFRSVTIIWLEEGGTK